MDTNELNSVQDEQFGEKTTENNLTPTSGQDADKSSVPSEMEKVELQNNPAIELPETNVVEEEIENEDPDNVERSTFDGVDFSKLSKKELVDKLAQILKEKSIDVIKEEADVIKSNFYKKHKAENERSRKEFVENGGNLEEYKHEEDADEQRLHELLKIYKERKSEHSQRIEAEKDENYKNKLSIIEKIKDLINGSESLNDTFHHFTELQKQWRSAGPIPQQHLNDLWESYNHQVEKFYDYIKINKELRDLDFKRNLEAKLQLCEKAEDLLLETDVVSAFRKLQDLHIKWREVGPVSRENRNDLWTRFKDATSVINKRHQDHFEHLKDEQKSNLEAKTLLCEKAEEIAKSEVSSIKDWEAKSKDIIEIQTIWKTIGFAPKKDNNRIYSRFREANDEFFKKKRDFFARAKDEQMNNLQLKTDLCIQAEGLKDSTEWKKSTDELINIQKKWKEIGPVPRKHSDIIWKRFRSACDEFFNRKSAHFASVDNQYTENLAKKEALIAEIEAYTFIDDVEQNFQNLKDFQRRWTEIGFIPLKSKDEVYGRFKKAIDKHYSALRSDESSRKMTNFKSRVEHMSHGNQNKVNNEREKLISRLRKIESDIAIWENNIGFFAKSKNAEGLISDVRAKIEQAREEIKTLEEKINLIDTI